METLCWDFEWMLQLTAFYLTWSYAVFPPVCRLFYLYFYKACAGLVLNPNVMSFTIIAASGPDLVWHWIEQIWPITKGFKSRWYFWRANSLKHKGVIKGHWEIEPKSDFFFFKVMFYWSSFRQFFLVPQSENMFLIMNIMRKDIDSGKWKQCLGMKRSFKN